MSANGFKKNLVVAGFATTFLFILNTLFYAFSLYRVKVYDVSKTFYFLAVGEVHIQASTAEIQYDGGAGYLLDYQDKEYVALAVYLQGDEIEAVQASVSNDYENAKILTLRSGKLYMKGLQKARAKRIVGALESLYGNMQVLSLEISRLANGATQSTSKCILSSIERNLRFLGAENVDIFPAYSVVCNQASDLLKSYTEDIVYVKDLRYLLCETCMEYIELCTEYAL